MSYQNTGRGNGKIYLGHTKFHINNKNVCPFASKSARNNFFTENLNLIESTFIFNDPNDWLKIDGRINNLNKINYAFIQFDSDFGSETYCCFIEDYKFLAPRTTALKLKIDPFQQFFYDTTFYDSYIERGHISKKNDVMGYNTLPEPFNYLPDFKKEIDIFNNADWSVQWVAQTLSRVATGSTEYKYGGVGNGDEFSGTFAFSLGAGNTGADVLLNRYYKAGETIDHRNDVINVVACPKWVLEPNATSLDEWGYLTRNGYINNDDTISVNSNTLACGYTPRNKKLLSSICRVYVFYNRNGFSQPFKPELFTTNNPTIRISKRVLNSTGYNFFVNNYRGLDNNYFTVPYNASVNIAYNENVGTQQAMRTINGFSGLAGGIIGSATSIASGNVVGGITGLFDTATSAYTNIKSAYESVTKSIGNASEVSNIIPSNIKLRLLDCSPLYNECAEIDRFFDMYGYNISNIGSPRSYMFNRSVWNYIQTRNINLTANCPTNYQQELENIFNNGVTIWHSYSNFGNYDLNNN